MESEGPGTDGNEGDQQECVQRCSRDRNTCQQRAQEDLETRSKRCLRNFGMCIALCTPTLVQPWVYAVCYAGCCIYGFVCEIDNQKDKDTALRRCQEDYMKCLGDCGINIAEQ